MRLTLLSIVAGLVPVLANAATVSNTYFVDREISITDSSRGSIYVSAARFNTITIDDFDTSLGTLTGVRLDYNLAFLLSVDALDDPGIFSRAEIEAQVIGEQVLRVESSLAGLVVDSTSRTLSVECGTGVFATDDCDGDAISEAVNVSKTGSVSYTPATFFGDIGTTPVLRVLSTLRVRLRDGEETTGLVDLMPSSGPQFNVTVSYDYDPLDVSAVPLPAAGWALLASLGMLVGVRGTRKGLRPD